MIVGAILGGVALGYFMRDRPAESPSSGEPAAAPMRNPPREARVSGGRPGLSAESQQRLDDLEALAASDPKKALTRLPAFRDTELLQLALSAVARGWARSDPQAAAEWTAGLESSDDQVAAALGLIPVWTSQNPEECLTWTSTRPAGNLREVSLVEIADTWVGKDPETALGRFLAMTPETGSERGLHVITAQWAIDDPDKAIESVAALPPEQRRDEFLETVLVSLTNEDPRHAWSEATRFNDPKRVEHVRCMAVEAMAETRPQDALRLAASVGSPPALLESIAGSWAAWDAPAAKAWIATLPDAELAQRLNAKIEGEPESQAPAARD